MPILITVIAVWNAKGEIKTGTPGEIGKMLHCLQMRAASSLLPVPKVESLAC
jgi:hypothetical protein